MAWTGLLLGATAVLAATKESTSLQGNKQVLFAIPCGNDEIWLVRTPKEKLSTGNDE
jgi:hypothetical protein